MVDGVGGERGSRGDYYHIYRSYSSITGEVGTSLGFFPKAGKQLFLTDGQLHNLRRKIVPSKMYFKIVIVRSFVAIDTTFSNK